MIEPIFPDQESPYSLLGLDTQALEGKDKDEIREIVITARDQKVAEKPEDERRIFSTAAELLTLRNRIFIDLRIALGRAITKVNSDTLRAAAEYSPVQDLFAPHARRVNKPDTKAIFRLGGKEYNVDPNIPEGFATLVDLVKTEKLKGGADLEAAKIIKHAVDRDTDHGRETLRLLHAFFPDLRSFAEPARGPVSGPANSPADPIRPGAPATPTRDSR